MRCSEFRDLHCAFIDDTLAGVEIVRMQRHIAECPECAEHDVRVRRSLMVLRSLSPIEPSADFSARLDRRLHECRLQDAHATGVSFRTVASVGMLMSVAMLVYMGESLTGHAARHEPGRDIVLPPVVALAAPPARQTALAADTVSNEANAIVASVGAGVPVWPAALLTEQPSVQLVSYSEGR